MSTRQTRGNAKNTQQKTAASATTQKSARGAKETETNEEDAASKPAKNVVNKQEKGKAKETAEPAPSQQDSNVKGDDSPSLAAGRSTRRRMPSKRFQDMEMDFGKKSSPQKAAKRRKLDVENIEDKSAKTISKPATSTKVNKTTKGAVTGGKESTDDPVPNNGRPKTTSSQTSTKADAAETINVTEDVLDQADTPSPKQTRVLAETVESEQVTEKMDVDQEETVELTIAEEQIGTTQSPAVQSTPPVSQNQPDENSPQTSRERTAPSVKPAAVVTSLVAKSPVVRRQPNILVHNKTDAANKSKGVSLLTGKVVPSTSPVKPAGASNVVPASMISGSQSLTPGGTKVIRFTKTASSKVPPPSGSIEGGKAVVEESGGDQSKPQSVDPAALQISEVESVAIETNEEVAVTSSTTVEVSSVNQVDQPSTEQGEGETSSVNEVNVVVQMKTEPCETDDSDLTSSNADTPIAEVSPITQVSTFETSSTDKTPPPTGKVVKNITNDPTNKSGSTIQVIEITKEQAQSGQILLLTSNKAGEQNIVLMDNLASTAPVATPTPVQMVSANRSNSYLSVTMGVDAETNKSFTTYQCKQCDYSTDKKTNFYKHKLSHTEKKHHCPHPGCDYRAKSNSNLKRHLLIHDNKRNYDCPICDLKFRQKIHVERHVKYKHQEKSVKCPLCRYTCANENPDLKLHMRRKHQPRPTVPSEGISCQLCDFVAATKKDLQQHMKFHRRGPEMKLFCEQCSFVTDCKSRLDRHLYTHSQEKPYSCGMCTYSAGQKEHVVRHMKSKHGVELPPGAKKQRRSEVEQTNRLFTNGDKKIFACNFCTMKFEKVINLYKHLHQQHAESMPPERPNMYSCVVCEFTTTRKMNLLVHMRKHNLPCTEDDDNGFPSGQVYSCVLCNYVNPKRRNLYMHMKKKHKICIMVRKDGSANCIVEENAPVTIVTKGKEPAETETPEETAVQQVSVISNDDTRYVDISELTSSLTTRKDINSPPAVAAEVQVQHEAAEAIEGLQALSEYKGGITPQPWSNTVTTVAEVTSESSSVVATAPSSNDSTTRPNIQLSQEQLTQLSSGDYIEINGEMYKVEFSEETQTTTE